MLENKKENEKEDKKEKGNGSKKKDKKYCKTNRVLELYEKLMNGEKINIENLSLEWSTSRRTIERYIAAAKEHFSKLGLECVYSWEEKNYILNGTERKKKLTQSEALAVTKILLESRALKKEEMYSIIDKIIEECTATDDYKRINAMIENEKYHYIELTHYKNSENNPGFVENLFSYGEAIKNQNKLEIRYRKTNGDVVERKIHPVGLVFSEYYFYLLGNIENLEIENNNNCPTIYRIDRIEKMKILDEKFKNHYYKNKFQEGEFRKRIHFMTGGELKKIKFSYKGNSLEAILDKIPTAKVIKNSEEENIVLAEVYKKGFDRWLNGQLNDIEILEEK